MSLCPYTYVKNFLMGSRKANGEASNLFVKVIKEGVETVSVALPAKSARWLIDLIPHDVVTQIKKEKIPLEQIQEDLKNKEKLLPQSIFTLIEPHRSVQVWLE